MNMRFLIALPIAAGVVVALIWAMREFVPVGRVQADYRIVISEEKALAQLSEEESRVTEFELDLIPPPPIPAPPEPIERQPMPREKFPPPERDEPENVIERQGVHSHCYPHRTGPLIEFPDGAREGDRVTVEFAISPEGRVTDVRVIQSSNPAINDAVVEMVGRWRWARPGHCGRQLAVKQKARTGRTEIQFRKPDHP